MTTPTPVPFVPPTVLGKIKAELLTVSGICLALVVAAGQFVTFMHLSGANSALVGEGLAALSALALVFKELANSGVFGVKR